MSQTNFRISIFSLCCLYLLFIGTSIPVAAQTANAPARTTSVKPKSGSFNMKVEPDSLQPISLVAEKAPISQITTQIGKELGIEIALSSTVAAETATLDLPESTVEAVFRELAPLAMIEYEISSSEPRPRPVVAYLYAVGEEIPAKLGTRPTVDQSVMMISGNTEEGTPEYEAIRAEEEAKKPVLVKLGVNTLSVRAKQQPIMLVGHELAQELGIPFHVVNDSQELVSAEFTDVPVDRAFASYLPGSLRLRQRIFSDTQQAEWVEIYLKNQPTKVKPAKTAKTTRQAKS